MTPDTTCPRNCLNMGEIEIQQQNHVNHVNGILTFTLHIFLVLVYWTMPFLRRHVTVHFDYFLIFFTSKTKAFKVTTTKFKVSQGYSNLYLTDIFDSVLLKKCHSFADMLQYILTTFSSLLPLKPRVFKVPCV